MEAQSHMQTQSEKVDLKKGKGITEVDSDMEEFEDDESFQGKMMTGSHPPVLKTDSHTRPCSLERLPSAEEFIEVEEEEEGNEYIFRFQRIAQSFTSDFPHFQICLERACVDEAFLLVRTLALSLFSLTFVLLQLIDISFGELFPNGPLSV